MLLNEKEEKREGNSDSIKINNSDNLIKDYVKFSRRVVRDKPQYEYEFVKVGNPSDFEFLKDVAYTKDQLDNAILNAKIEDKVNEYKKELAEQ